MWQEIYKSCNNYVKKRLIITFNIKVINSTIQYYFKKSEQNIKLKIGYICKLTIVESN